VAGGDFDCGVLICGTGIGMSIAANKVRGIRAALCHDEFTAARARQHNDANILCLAAEGNQSAAAEIVDIFLTTPFEGGRHQLRLDKIKTMES
jgi:ribose 5-phosphate isomerase B